MKINAVTIVLILAGSMIACNSNDSRNTHETPESIPEGKEIKLEEVDSQLKSDAEKADSMKRALGIE